MKVTFFFLTLLSFTLLSSCKKKETTPPPADELYISFKLDGVDKKFSTTNFITNSNSGGVGGNLAYISSGFYDLEKEIFINFDVQKDSIVGADYQAAIGQNIPVCDNCPISMGLRYAINGNDYSSSQSNNPFPANYFKINSVTFYRLNTSLGQNVKEYIITGEFNTKINYSTTVKNVTEGKFRLIFQEMIP